MYNLNLNSNTKPMGKMLRKRSKLHSSHALAAIYFIPINEYRKPNGQNLSFIRIFQPKGRC